jgi:DNA-binding winged helix-turn-helix (wHTH) protein
MFCFGNMVLDSERRELRSGSVCVPIEPQVFDLLEFLIRNRDRVVSKDDLVTSVWHRRVVSEAAIAARINAVRRAIGDDGKQQRWIRTIARKGFRFVGDVREAAVLERPSVERNGAQRTQGDLSSRQEITFCRTKDSIRIAVASIGQGVPLVSIPTWLSNIDHDWQNPFRAPLWHFLADRFRLIRYDGRGFGLSDRDIPDISIETLRLDLEAVVDGLGLRSYILFGISQGVATAIAHAAYHPERVSKLILHGGFALGRNKRNSSKESELAKTLIAILRQGFGDDNSALLRAFSSVFFPGAPPEQIRWWAHLLRISTSVENVIKNRNGVDEIDVVDLLPKVSAPTLVLHCRHDNAAPFDEGRRIAASIPDSRFVSLDSENHTPLFGEPAWPAFLEAIDTFLSEDRETQEQTRMS